MCDQVSNQCSFELKGCGVRKREGFFKQKKITKQTDTFQVSLKKQVLNDSLQFQLCMHRFRPFLCQILFFYCRCVLGCGVVFKILNITTPRWVADVVLDVFLVFLVFGRFFPLLLLILFFVCASIFTPLCGVLFVELCLFSCFDTLGF